jgi:hypothetical protein
MNRLGDPACSDLAKYADDIFWGLKRAGPALKREPSAVL